MLPYREFKRRKQLFEKVFGNQSTYRGSLGGAYFVYERPGKQTIQHFILKIDLDPTNQQMLTQRCLRKDDIALLLDTYIYYYYYVVS